jgi:hypothetical protein
MVEKAAGKAASEFEGTLGVYSSALYALAGIEKPNSMTDE